MTISRSMIQELLAMFALLDTSAIEQFLGETKAQMGGRDLPSVAIMVIVTGVVLFVGINIMSNVVTSTNLQSGDPFYNATQTLETDFDTAFSNMGLAVTIVIFAVIIVYLYGLRGGGR